MLVLATLAANGHITNPCKLPDSKHHSRGRELMEAEKEGRRREAGRPSQGGPGRVSLSFCKPQSGPSGATSNSPHPFIHGTRAWDRRAPGSSQLQEPGTCFLLPVSLLGTRSEFTAQISSLPDPAFFLSLCFLQTGTLPRKSPGDSWVMDPGSPQLRYACPEPPYLQRRMENWEWPRF